MKSAALFLPFLLTACMISEGSYEETNTVRFNGSGNSVTETTSGSYRGTAPLAGSAYIISPNAVISVSSPQPAPPVNRGRYSSPYSGIVRTYSDGSTVITRGTGVIQGGCTRSVHRNGQIYQTPIPCP